LSSEWVCRVAKGPECMSGELTLAWIGVVGRGGVVNKPKMENALETEHR
jgi:hypothetical protein